MTIQILLGDNGPDYHRLYTPYKNFDDIIWVKAEILQKDPLLIQWVFTDKQGNKVESKVGDCDVLVFNRANIHPQYLDMIKKTQKCKIVMDVDDYWELDASHPLHDWWYHYQNNERLKYLLTQVDLVTVTNRQLQEKALSFNKNVEILPNSLPKEGQYIEPNIKLDTTLNYIYCGGSTHYPDVSLLKNKFSRYSNMSESFDSKFILAGYDNSNQDKRNVWDKMVSVFKNNRNYEIRKTLPIHTYMQQYNNADVALVPLVDNTFNKCKSFLKVSEAAAKGLPCICSRVLPYTELLDAPGIYWVDNNDWVSAFQYFYKNKDKVKDMGEQLKNYLDTNYNFETINNKRWNLLQSL